MTAVYIHIPYCKSKCPYCDFASVPVDGSVSAYIRALAAEAASAPETSRLAETVYVGGGTPTVLSPEQLCRFFEHVVNAFPISADAEITVEANPCSLDPATVEALVAGGANRVNLGAQSFVDAELSCLGRSHETRDTTRSFSLLRQAGIGNVNLDLIYAIPNQSSESWSYSLAQAIELEPEHISTYCLTFERATPLWRSLQRGKTEKKSDDEELELYEIARETLTHAGYEHYEISNFALPGKRSRHNTVYWSNEEYLGLGASAVSYRGGTRITNLSRPETYVRAVETRGSTACEIEEIPLDMQAVETAIQRLRLREGIDCAAFTARFGFHPQDMFGDALSDLIEMGLLEQSADAIRSSLKGWHLANEVALRILP